MISKLIYTLPDWLYMKLRAPLAVKTKLLHYLVEIACFTHQVFLSTIVLLFPNSGFFSLQLVQLFLLSTSAQSFSTCCISKTDTDISFPARPCCVRLPCVHACSWKRVSAQSLLELPFDRTTSHYVSETS